MTDQKRNLLIAGSTTLLAAVVAYTFRLVGKGSFYPTLFSYLRSIIYIGLYAAWGLPVRQRIVQKQVWRYLTGLSVLLILWFSFRTVKYFIFWQPTVIRHLWYLFYLPMLFVPMLALLVAMSLGRLDDYRLPKWAMVLWLVSGALLLLVLTNDLHQLVFTFPKDAAVWSDTDHGYGIAYFSVIGWQVLCGVSALVVMLIKCRLKNGRHRLWPAVPMAISLTYLAPNYIGVPWLKTLFGDVTAFQSFLHMLSFEACIACGFIRSNSRYADLFASSVGTSAEITDRDYKIPVAELERAFNESLQTLKLLGVRSTLYVDDSLSMFSGKAAAAIFDFYESVVETDLENLTSVQVSLAKAEGLRLSLNICCKADLSAFAAKPNVRYEADEDYQHIVFLAEGGTAK